MARLIITRLLTLIPMMFLITSVVFFMIRFVPGDPAKIIVGNQRITEKNLQNIRVQYRLDKPVLVQYGYWLRDLSHGNLGRSFQQRTEVRTLILERLPLTIKLTVYAFVISLITSIPLGILAAVKRDSWFDLAATTFSLLGASSPIFFTSILLILIFSYQLSWLPAIGAGDSGLDQLKHLFLPSLALGFSLAAITMRITRSAMVEALGQDYIEAARAKGLSSRSVILKHGFRNALIPVLTVAGLQLGFCITGAILVERAFALGGVGSLLIDAVLKRDYPIVQGVTVFIALVFILINLIVDVLYGIVDPRVRYGSGS